MAKNQKILLDALKGTLQQIEMELSQITLESNAGYPRNQTLQRLLDIRKQLKTMGPSIEHPPQIWGIPLGTSKVNTGEERLIAELGLQCQGLTAILHAWREEFETGKLAIQKLLAEAKIFKQRSKELINNIAEFDHAINNYVDKYKEISLLVEFTNSPEANVSKPDQDLQTLIEEHLKKTPDELYTIIGKEIPISISDHQIVIEQLAVKYLSDSTVTLLPPESLEKDTAPQIDTSVNEEKFGRKLFKGLKGTLHRVLCDADHRVGSSYFNKDTISKAILASMGAIGIKSISVVAPIIAVILLFGLEYYCQQ